MGGSPVPTCVPPGTQERIAGPQVCSARNTRGDRRSAGVFCPQHKGGSPVRRCVLPGAQGGIAGPPVCSARSTRGDRRSAGVFCPQHKGGSPAPLCVPPETQGGSPVRRCVPPGTQYAPGLAQVWLHVSARARIHDRTCNSRAAPHPNPLPTHVGRGDSVVAGARRCRQRRAQCCLSLSQVRALPAVGARSSVPSPHVSGERGTVLSQVGAGAARGARSAACRCRKCAHHPPGARAAQSPLPT
jgi:hypothetical protein